MGGSSGDVEAGSASRFSTLQNLIKPFVGAGILALPNAFEVGGVLASAILMATLAIGVNYCIRCLLTSVDYVYAVQHGLEYDTKSGVFSLSKDESNVRSNGVHHRHIQVNDTDASNEASTTHANGVGYDASLPLTSSPDDDDFAISSTEPAPIALASRDAVGTPNGNGKYVNGNKYQSVNRTPTDLTKVEPMYSFREIGDFAFGKYGCLAVDVNLVASQIGFCIAYMSFISQNMVKVVDGLTRIEWIIILFVGWSILVQVRDIRKIGFTSLFGNLVYVTSLCIIFYDGFAHHCCVTAAETSWIKPEGLALVFGTGCFALEGIGLILPVKRAMKEKDKFSSTLNIALTFVTGCYVLFGVLGYLFYGSEVHSVITDNLRPGPLTDAVRVSLSISLVFSYAIQLFPVSEIIDGLWDSHVFKVGGVGANDETPEKYQALREDSTTYDSFEHRDDTDGVDLTVPPSPVLKPVAFKSSRPINYKREFALISSRIGLVAFTAIISIVFPNFGLIVSLVGSFSNSAIAFILPQIFYIKLVVMPEANRTGTDTSTNFWVRYKSFMLPYIIIVLGVCASIIGVYTTIHAMVTGEES